METTKVFILLFFLCCIGSSDAQKLPVNVVGTFGAVYGKPCEVKTVLQGQNSSGGLTTCGVIETQNFTRYMDVQSYMVKTGARIMSSVKEDAVIVAPSVNSEMSLKISFRIFSETKPAIVINANVGDILRMKDSMNTIIPQTWKAEFGKTVEMAREYLATANGSFYARNIQDSWIMFISSGTFGAFSPPMTLDMEGILVGRSYLPQIPLGDYKPNTNLNQYGYGGYWYGYIYPETRWYSYVWEQVYDFVRNFEMWCMGNESNLYMQSTNYVRMSLQETNQYTQSGGLITPPTLTMTPQGLLLIGMTAGTDTKVFISEDMQNWQMSTNLPWYMNVSQVSFWLPTNIYQKLFFKASSE
jgi:hypothetical protein